MVSVLGRAVDEVLLGKGDELSQLASVLSFEGSGGGEGPARSAHSLVLDISDEVGITPVNLIWDLNIEWSQERGGVLDSGVTEETSVTVEFAVLAEWQVSNMIQSHLECLSSESVISVVILNMDHILDKCLHIGLLLALRVLLIKVLLIVVPFLDGRLDLTGQLGRIDGDDGGNQCQKNESV